MRITFLLLPGLVWDACSVEAYRCCSKGSPACLRLVLPALVAGPLLVLPALVAGPLYTYLSVCIYI